MTNKYHQMTLTDWAKNKPKESKDYVPKPRHPNLEKDIVKAMRMSMAEKISLGFDINPMFPADVLGWLPSEPLPSVTTIRARMRDMAKDKHSPLVRMGQRKGYLLRYYVGSKN